MTPLAAEIAALIAAEGPIGVDRYIGVCLGHPRHGYYMTRDPFGAQGDFVTAPEVSQMFGELIGLWCADLWQQMGGPATLRLVELGPGRGTLMADALRAARILPAFRQALDVHLVETSPVLRQRQRAALEPAGVPLSWHDDISTLPEGPLLVIANEFFDALPTRQFVVQAGRWHERLVGLTAEGALTFGLAGEPAADLRMPAPEGSLIEVSTVASSIMETLASRVMASSGAVLAIDYGHAATGFGDTLQALRGHQFVHPLAEPGESDLTVHVDFAALGAAARRSGAVVNGPVTQGRFLMDLGLASRAAVLAEQADAAGRAALQAAVDRLVGSGPSQMGELFKVMAVANPRLSPAGFDSMDADAEPRPGHDGTEMPHERG